MLTIRFPVNTDNWAQLGAVELNSIDIFCVMSLSIEQIYIVF